MNYLKSVFWEYPQFQKKEYVESIIKDAKLKNDDKLFEWILSRFIEYGRVVDTFEFFSISEIAFYLPKLKLSKYIRKKWSRLMEVYNAS
jgi:hypothetical protein